MFTPFLLLGAALVPLQDDETGHGSAFVEVEVDPPVVVVGQSVRLVLRFGVERGLAQQHLVQPFLRPLDLPVQLRTGDLESLSGLLLEPAQVVSGGRTFVWDGAPAQGRALDGHRRAGSDFVALEVERRFVPTRPGTLVLPAARLEFAHASGFREDVVHGRVALDRRDAFVRGEPASVEVRSLPEQGRPLEFAGAVGRFEVWARADRRRLELGEGLTLTLEVDGGGHLADALSSWPARVEGFMVRGRTGDGPGRVVLDLAPVDAEVQEVPAIRLSFFDPASGAYSSASSEPIPIEVRSRAGDSVVPPGPPPSQEPPGSSVDLRWIGAGVLVLALGLVGLLVGRGRRGSRPDPHAGVVAAAAVLARERLRAEEEPREVLVQLLAAVLDCASPGVVGPRLAERLTAAGLSLELSQGVEHGLQAWERARFGGAPGEGEGAAARTLVDRIDGEVGG